MCDESDCECSKPSGRDACHCEGRDKFIDPCLLLLIAQQPSHGYDLIERIERYGFVDVDPTKAYRHLRRLESEGFLKSTWSSESPGPAKREYRITTEGMDFLATWPPSIQKSIAAYEAFLADLGKLKG